MEYQANHRPVEQRDVAVEDKCAWVSEGLHREVQLGEQRPGAPPGPQAGPGTRPGPGPGAGTRPGPGFGPGSGQTTMAAVVVNTKEPRSFNSTSGGPPVFPTSSSSASLFSSTSSNLDSQSSPKSEGGVDCAGLVLDCLFCKFYELLVMLPASCERAAHRCCPAYKHFSAQASGGGGGGPGEGQSSMLDCDWGLLDACEDTGDCLELAMEMSEMCYR